MPAGSRGHPRLDLGMLVRGVVVHDHVDIQLRRHRQVDHAEE